MSRKSSNTLKQTLKLAPAKLIPSKFAPVKLVPAKPMSTKLAPTKLTTTKRSPTKLKLVPTKLTKKKRAFATTPNYPKFEPDEQVLISGLSAKIMWAAGRTAYVVYANGRDDYVNVMDLARKVQN